MLCFETTTIFDIGSFDWTRNCIVFDQLAYDFDIGQNQKGL